MAWKIGVLVVIIAIVVAVVFVTKGQKIADFQDKGRQMVKRFPEYEKHKEFYDEAFDACHEPAFKLAQAISESAKSKEINERTYLSMLIALTKTKAMFPKSNGEQGEKEIAAGNEIVDLLEKYSVSMGLDGGMTMPMGDSKDFSSGQPKTQLKEEPKTNSKTETNTKPVEPAVSK